MGGLVEPKATLGPSVLDEGDLNLEIIEIPIGALGGQQVFKLLIGVLPLPLAGKL